MRIYLPLLLLPGARGHPSDGIQPGKNVIFILVRGIPLGAWEAKYHIRLIRVCRQVIAQLIKITGSLKGTILKFL